MSTLWIAAREQVQGLRHWHVHRRKILVVCFLVAVLVWLFATTTVRTQGPGDGPAPGSEKVSSFMQEKLKHSQKLLEALAIEDYDGIVKNSQAISLLCEDEIWQVLQSPDYLHYTKEFRRAANVVTEAGRKKNLDGAALGYVDMTLKCVQCHKYVRGVRASDTPELRKSILK